MSKAVMISIQPKWCELIASGKKTIEVRKTIPKIATPFKCYIYCTNNGGSLHIGCGMYGEGFELFYHKSNIAKDDLSCLNSKVIGEFVCNQIFEYEMEGYDKNENVYQGINRLAYDEDWEETVEYTEISNAMTVDEMKCSSLLSHSQLSFDEIGKYVCGKEFGFHKFYGWHISNLVIYDKPKELSEFWKADICPYASENGCTFKYHCFRSGQVKRCGETLTRPPQSWCYVEKLK